MFRSDEAFHDVIVLGKKRLIHQTSLSGLKCWWSIFFLKTAFFNILKLKLAEKLARFVVVVGRL